MTDLSGKPLARLMDAEARLQSYFALYGYQRLAMPILEPTELFLRKSGGELAVRMYAFADSGGNQVSLRPEFTASVARHYMEHAEATPLPWRVQYAGPVFRYQPAGDAPRQFTQVGAELLGVPGPEADAEVVCMCARALQDLGLTGFSVVLGDAGVYSNMLASLGLSERARLFILGSLPRLREGTGGLEAVAASARRIHLLTDRPADELGAAVRNLDEGEARELLHQLLLRSANSPMGQRTLSDVEERLLFKMRGGDDPQRLATGIKLAGRLAVVRGAPADALTAAKRVLSDGGIDSPALRRLEEAVSMIALHGVDGDTLTLDFGLARGIAYYTGIVFEVAMREGGLSLGGGGRYDTLMRALGHPEDVPALGFALTLENVVQATHGNGHAEDSSASVLVVPSRRDAYAAALNVAEELRRQGARAELELRGCGTAEAIVYARARGLTKVIEVDAAGSTTVHPISGGRE